MNGPIEECYFYHSIDLPGRPPIVGAWDLRAGVDAYLGGISVAGKKVLEVGAANGFLSFHLEKRGAQSGLEGKAEPRRLRRDEIVEQKPRRYEHQEQTEPQGALITERHVPRRFEQTSQEHRVHNGRENADEDGGS